MKRIKQFVTEHYGIYLVIEKMYMCLFKIMNIFPIQNNKIVFCATKGKRYGDNPMYISDELIKRNRNYDIVWLLKKDVEVEIPKGIRRAKYNLFTEIYELTTAKVWVDCNTKNSGVLKRRNQLYVQTWHGSYGIKKIGRDLGDKLESTEKRFYTSNAKITDLMVSNSKQTTEIYRRALWYSGEMLECGSPRNDIFFGECNEKIKKVEQYFGIRNQKIVLYAPTFRCSHSTDKFKLNYEKLLETLTKKFGGEWIVLVRLHPNNLNAAKNATEYNDKVKNASLYSIMQELLAATDVLITDYSSCMFDFATTGKTCFLYATDVEEYRNDRDYYFDIKDLPFPLAENNEQLEKNILNFDEEVYQKKLHELFEQVGLCETGHASEKVADYIEQWMKEN